MMRSITDAHEMGNIITWINANNEDRDVCDTNVPYKRFMCSAKLYLYCYIYMDENNWIIAELVVRFFLAQVDHRG